MDTSVYYIDIERPKRGHYVARMVKIADTLSDKPIFYATERYFRLLEDTICRHPQYWLWSHKRWKRTREEFNRLFSEEEPQEASQPFVVLRLNRRFRRNNPAVK